MSTVSQAISSNTITTWFNFDDDDENICNSNRHGILLLHLLQSTLLFAYWLLTRAVIAVAVPNGLAKCCTRGIKYKFDRQFPVARTGKCSYDIIIAHTHTYTYTMYWWHPPSKRGVYLVHDVRRWWPNGHGRWAKFVLFFISFYTRARALVKYYLHLDDDGWQEEELSQRGLGGGGCLNNYVHCAVKQISCRLVLRVSEEASSFWFILFFITARISSVKRQAVASE